PEVIAESAEVRFLRQHWPAPHPASQSAYPRWGRAGVRAGAASPERSSVGGDFRLHDLAGRFRRLALGQGVHMLHAGGDFAPHRILIVEEARVVEADEELAVRAVRVGGARHGGDAAHM